MDKHQIQSWQHVSSQVLLHHPRVTVVEDTVVLPSGHETRWWRIDGARDFVSVICLDEQGRVLVAYQYNHPVHKVVDEFPGGVVDEGEDALTVARRELLEEIGLYAREVRMLGAFYPNNRRSEHKCYVVLATDLEQRSAAPEETEVIAYEWLPVRELEAALRAGTLENGILMAAWGLYKLLGETD